jgi:hypothetical protein
MHARCWALVLISTGRAANANDDTVVVVAIRDIKKGEQLLLSYIDQNMR